MLFTHMRFLAVILQQRNVLFSGFPPVCPIYVSFTNVLSMIQILPATLGQ